MSGCDYFARRFFVLLPKAVLCKLYCGVFCSFKLLLDRHSNCYIDTCLVYEPQFVVAPRLVGDAAVLEGVVSESHFHFIIVFGVCSHEYGGGVPCPGSRNFSLSRDRPTQSLQHERLRPNTCVQEQNRAPASRMFTGSAHVRQPTLVHQPAYVQTPAFLRSIPVKSTA